MTPLVLRNTSIFFLSLFLSFPASAYKVSGKDVDNKQVSKRCFGVWHPGRWSKWGPWSTCSNTCGYGWMSRSRICLRVLPFECCQSCFGKDKEYSACVAYTACKVTSKPITTNIPSTATKDPTTVFRQSTKTGNWLPWMPWSLCSASCGMGSRIRHRICQGQVSTCKGKFCVGSHEEAQICLQKECTVNGDWSTWGPWGPCSSSCGKGVRQRTRLCNSPAPGHGGRHCRGDYLKSKQCRLESCPANGEWSPWDPWGPCSSSCGRGVRQRTRLCNSPAPGHGGLNCSGDYLRSISCQQESCPVDGQWSQWLQWSSCSASCGNGTKLRIRLCNNPSPIYGGKSCNGNPLESLVCNDNPCAVNGSWSGWQAWGQCSKSCGSGVRERKRTCSHPRPANGGKNCPGSQKDISICNTHNCAVDGHWSAWNQASLCTATCGGGSMGQIRSCNNPAPKDGGKPCNGQLFRTISCNTAKCPAIDGNWGQWQQASLCTTSCGGGIMGQRRSCDHPAPKHGGKPCKGTEFRTVRCNTASCPTTKHVIPTTPSTKLTTAFQQATKTRSSTKVPHFAWQTIYIPGR